MVPKISLNSPPRLRYGPLMVSGTWAIFCHGIPIGGPKRVLSPKSTVPGWTAFCRRYPTNLVSIEYPSEGLPIGYLTSGGRLATSQSSGYPLLAQFSPFWGPHPGDLRPWLGATFGQIRSGQGRGDGTRPGYVLRAHTTHYQ